MESQQVLVTPGALDAEAMQEAKRALKTIKTPNPGSNHIGMVYGKEITCDTASGAAWVEKYLHPPSERRSEYSGIPDENCSPGVDYEFRIQDELGVSVLQGATGTEVTKMLIISPPSVLRNRLVFGINPVNDTATPATPLNTPNPNITRDSFNSSVEAWRMTYLSDTYELDSTAFTNAGMFYGCQFRPNVANYEATTNTLEKDLKPLAKHKGFNELLARIKNHTKTSKGYGDFVDLKEAGTNVLVQVISLGKIPTTGGEVLMKSTKSSSWLAKEGAFMVHRFSERTQKYVSNTRKYLTVIDGSTIAGTNGAFVVCYYETYDKATDTYTLHNWTASELVPEANALDAAPWYDMTWSMLMYDFTALSGQINVIPALPSIVHKKIFGIETQPLFGSLQTALVRQCPYVDIAALHLGALYSNATTDMLPARANSLGGLLVKAAQYAPAVLDLVKNVFGRKPENQASDKAIEKLNRKIDKLEMATHAPNSVRPKTEVVVVKQKVKPRLTAAQKAKILTGGK